MPMGIVSARWYLTAVRPQLWSSHLMVDWKSLNCDHGFHTIGIGCQFDYYFLWQHRTGKCCVDEEESMRTFIHIKQLLGFLSFSLQVNLFNFSNLKWRVDRDGWVADLSIFYFLFIHLFVWGHPQRPNTPQTLGADWYFLIDSANHRARHTADSGMCRQARGTLIQGKWQTFIKIPWTHKLS